MTGAAKRPSSPPLLRRDRPLDLTEIKTLYESSNIPVGELIERSGFRPATFYKMVKAENWALRHARKSDQPSTRRRANTARSVKSLPTDVPPVSEVRVPPLASSPHVASAELVRIDRTTVVRRAWATADAQMREIEERLSRLGGEPGTADSEREARLMATLVKTLRDLVALETEIDPLDRKEMGANGSDSASNQSGDDLRDELARRLARLRSER